MPEVRVPTMVVASCDDPWIPVEYYRDFDWAANPQLLPVMSPAGGHLGFHAHGSAQSWGDLAVRKYIDGLVDSLG